MYTYVIHCVLFENNKYYKTTVIKPSDIEMGSFLKRI